MNQAPYYQIILNCFTSLDINELRINLKEEYSYQDTSKDIFLSKVEEIFQAFTNSGDTELVPYSGACSSKSCYCGQTGYRFVGNNSKNYFSLLFKVKNDDILDIFDCSAFKTDIDLGKLGDSASINIDQDEEIGFRKTPEYIANLDAALKAYNEIITTPPSLLNFEDLNYWLDENAVTNAKIGDWGFFQPIMKWTPFSMLYDELRAYRTYIESYKHDFTKANESLNLITEEQNLIEWVLAYEVMFEEAPLDIKFLGIEKGEFFILEKNNPILLFGEQFIQALRFTNSYREKNETLRIKYNSITKDEENAIWAMPYSSEGKALSTYTLRFHLERRTAAKEAGIDIPFFYH